MVQCSKNTKLQCLSFAIPSASPSLQVSLPSIYPKNGCEGSLYIQTYSHEACPHPKVRDRLKRQESLLFFRIRYTVLEQHQTFPQVISLFRNISKFKFDLKRFKVSCSTKLEYYIEMPIWTHSLIGMPSIIFSVQCPQTKVRRKFSVDLIQPTRKSQVEILFLVMAMCLHYKPNFPQRKLILGS